MVSFLFYRIGQIALNGSKNELLDIKVNFKQKINFLTKTLELFWGACIIKDKKNEL